LTRGHHIQIFQQGLLWYCTFTIMSITIFIASSTQQRSITNFYEHSNVSVKYLALTYRGSRSKEIVNKGYVNAQNHGNGSKDFNSLTPNAPWDWQVGNRQCALTWHLNLRAWYLSTCISGCLATDTKIEHEIRAFQRRIMQENRSETRKVFQV
jgi:hypothetical protein